MEPHTTRGVGHDCVQNWPSVGGISHLRKEVHPLQLSHVLYTSCISLTIMPRRCGWYAVICTLDLWDCRGLTPYCSVVHTHFLFVRVLLSILSQPPVKNIHVLVNSCLFRPFTITYINTYLNDIFIASWYAYVVWSSDVCVCIAIHCICHTMLHNVCAVCAGRVIVCCCYCVSVSDAVCVCTYICKLVPI